jgi:hypothetical protein
MTMAFSSWRWLEQLSGRCWEPWASGPSCRSLTGRFPSLAGALDEQGQSLIWVPKWEINPHFIRYLYCILVGNHDQKPLDLGVYRFFRPTPFIYIYIVLLWLGLAKCHEGQTAFNSPPVVGTWMVETLQQIGWVIPWRPWWMNKLDKDERE